MKFVRTILATVGTLSDIDKVICDNTFYVNTAQQNRLRV